MALTSMSSPYFSLTGAYATSFCHASLPYSLRYAQLVVVHRITGEMTTSDPRLPRDEFPRLYVEVRSGESPDLLLRTTILHDGASQWNESTELLVPE